MARSTFGLENSILLIWQAVRDSPRPVQRFALLTFTLPFSFSCYYQGERFKEATKINLSLSALSNVISSLVSVFRVVSNHAVLYLVRWMVGVLMFLTVTPS